jgi:hypothetical protein
MKYKFSLNDEWMSNKMKIGLIGFGRAGKA